MGAWRGVEFIRQNRGEGTVLIAFFANDDEPFLVGVIGIVGMVVRGDQTLHKGFGGVVEGMIGWELIKVGGGFDGQHGAFSRLRCLVTGIKKPARGGFNKGGWGVF